MRNARRLGSPEAPAGQLSGPPTAIPLPAAAPLLLAGLAGLAAVCWRRTRAA